MSDLARVPDLVAGPGLLEDIGRWTTSEPLRLLVEAFGGSRDLFRGDVAQRLCRLDEFSDRWDTRKGVERNLAPSLDLTTDQETIVHCAASALGLKDSHPPQRDSYDHILMLGGLVRACVTRPAYAARLLASGAARAGSLTALGGHRPFRGNEFDLARAAGIPDVAEEFDALDAGTRLAFGLSTPVSSEGEASELPGRTWSVKTYTTADGLMVRVAAAPSSEPGRRADTADTYEWFARELAKLAPGQHLLAVTTSIYVPAQHAAALRMLALPYEVDVETIGFEPGDVTPELPQTFTPTNYLQEVRSTIRAVRDLYGAAAAR